MLLRLIMLFAIVCVWALAKDNNASLYDRGETLYLKNGCNTCHGNDGEGGGSYPHLANRAKGYLAYRLRQFRAGKASTPGEELMIGFASGLSDDDIDAVTTFLSDHHAADDEDQYIRPFDTTGGGSS